MKDPKRQYLGAQAKRKGKAFEDRLSATFEYYHLRGSALITKTHEPMKPIRDLGQGRFVACYEKKAEPDYKGTLKGGRTVMFEAKYTSADRIEQSRVLPQQADYMDDHTKLGARCFVVVGFDSGEVYLVPWDDWKNMKQLFGHKYATEQELQNYRVSTAWNGVLLILS